MTSVIARQLDPEAPRNAKFRRAERHLGDLDELLRMFAAGASVDYVSGEVRGETQAVLRLQHPLPAVDIAVIIGDVVHNLRSALDAVAFELARTHVETTRSKKSLRASSFPIHTTRDGLDTFFADRASIFGPDERCALEAVTPGFEYDIAVAGGSAIGEPRESAVHFDPIWQLNALWNIDKHRHLNLVVVWPGLVYWGSDRGNDFRWLVAPPPYADGSVLGTLKDLRFSEWKQRADLVAEIEVHLGEPNVGDSSVQSVLHGMAFRVRWAIDRCFQVWSQGDISSS